MTNPPDMNSDELATFIDRHLDRAYLLDTLVELAKVPTDVPIGWETLMEPDDPKLVHYVQDVLRHQLVELGLQPRTVALNNLLVELGSGVSGKSLLLQNYTPAQHHQYMEYPFSGRVGSAARYGYDEPAVFGLGVSQAKAHQATMLAVLKLLQEQKISLNGKLYWAVNNEGRSSHACSDAILDSLPEPPNFCIVQVDTGLACTLGNRGRVDVAIHVRGQATHSSAPHEGLSAIDGAFKVVERLKSLSWSDQHPQLGGRHAVVYKMRFAPLAPHTLPSDAHMVVDRRLLPRDDPDAATEEIRDVIGDISPYEVSVSRDVYMLPALVEPSDPGVQALSKSHAAILGEELPTTYSQGAFDAGGPIARGVPSVMYGGGGTTSLLGTDFAPVRIVEAEARVLAHLILSRLL